MAQFLCVQACWPAGGPILFRREPLSCFFSLKDSDAIKLLEEKIGKSEGYIKRFFRFKMSPKEGAAFSFRVWDVFEGLLCDGKQILPLLRLEQSLL